MLSKYKIKYIPFLMDEVGKGGRGKYIIALGLSPVGVLFSLCDR